MDIKKESIIELPQSYTLYTSKSNTLCLQTPYTGFQLTFWVKGSVKRSHSIEILFFLRKNWNLVNCYKISKISVLYKNFFPEYYLFRCPKVFQMECLIIIIISSRKGTLLGLLNILYFQLSKRECEVGLFFWFVVTRRTTSGEISRDLINSRNTTSKVWVKLLLSKSLTFRSKNKT